MSARRCTTHHHACDCREERFRAMEQELSTLREALNEAMGWNWLDAGMNEEVSNRLAALLQEKKE